MADSKHVSNEALLEEHRETVAAAWRKLERIVKRFERLLVKERQPKNELPIGPVRVWPPRLTRVSTKDAALGKTPELIGFKKPVAPKRGLALAAAAFGELEHQGDEKDSRSVRCYGAIGVPMRLIREAEKVNLVKDEFREALKPLAGRTMRALVRNAKGTAEPRTRDLATVMMRRIQSARVNLLAAYRHIPVYNEQVQTLAFYHVRSRSVEKKTAEQLIDMLASKHYAFAHSDIVQLRKIPSDEPLSRRKEDYGRISVRVKAARRYRHEETGRLRAVTDTMPAELPFLYPTHTSWADPEIKLPSFKRYENKPGQPRKGRRKELEPEPYIRSMAFHRKRKDIREVEAAKRQKKAAKKRKNSLGDRINDLLSDAS